MKFKHLFLSNRSLTNTTKHRRIILIPPSAFIHQVAPITTTSSSSSSSLRDLLTLKTPIFKHPISLFTRKIHSQLQVATPIDTTNDHDESDSEDGTMTEFLSRFVWIMRGKLADAYPDCDKPSINGMLLIIVEKVVEEIEKGEIEEMLEATSSSSSHDFSEDLWKIVWEISNSVLDDMKKARKKEALKKYIQSEEVKEMCRFASEVGIRGNMLREFRFKWAKVKMEEVEFYQGLERLREETRAQEREEKEKEEKMPENLSEEIVGDGSDVDLTVKPKIVSLPQRQGKIKYKIYGLDLSDPKWAEVADKIHESEKLIVPEEPKPITGKCKLVTEKILSLNDGDDLSTLLAEWVELLEPNRVNWFALLDGLRERNVGLYFKVAELILNEDSFQANIRDYSKLIDAHAKDNRIEDAERVLKKMSEKGIQADILTSTILVHMYSKAGNLDRAKEAFERLRSQGFQPDMRAYHSMIMAFVNGGEPKFGETLMREMEIRGIKPTKEIYMALLRAFSERGHVNSVHSISTTMHFAGFHPTLESCTLLVEAHAQAGDSETAKEKFEYMRKIGHKPDDRCTASLISVFGKKNFLDEALDLLLELETDGFEPGVATYSVLVDWLGKLQLIDEVEELLRKITEKGETPPLKVQVSLCDMYSRSRDEKKALQVLGILEGKKDLLGLDDFERIINGLLHGGLSQDAWKVHAMMEARGFSPSESLRVSLMASPAFRRQRPIAR